MGMAPPPEEPPEGEEEMYCSMGVAEEDVQVAAVYNQNGEWLVAASEKEEWRVWRVFE